MSFVYVDEFLMAAVDKWPNALVQFEDFTNDHAFPLLEKYRHRILCFNDDIQGTGATISAAFLNAIRLATKVKPKHHRILFFGAGAAGCGVAMSICQLLQLRHKLTFDDARK
mmetsp:Transcript_13221/g.31541  ORF Transcript_13221/g.31541 Transcript_13221/m.31541 type:complete len:112 (-) Transcript_13221:1217-1552(-)